MLILLDQDGVLADFEHAFLDAWRSRHPDIAPLPYESRRSFRILDDYPPELRASAAAIYTAPGFLPNLPPLAAQGAASRHLISLGLAAGTDPRTLLPSEHCQPEISP